MSKATSEENSAVTSSQETSSSQSASNAKPVTLEHVMVRYEEKTMRAVHGDGATFIEFEGLLLASTEGVRAGFDYRFRRYWMRVPPETWCEVEVDDATVRAARDKLELNDAVFAPDQDRSRWAP